MLQSFKNRHGRCHGRHTIAGMALQAISSLWLLVFLMGAAFPAPSNAQTADRGWPRTIHSNGIQIDVYQPQVDKWENGKLEDRTTIVVTDKNTGQSTYGTAWLSGRTTVDQDKRLVTLYDIDVSNVVFPSAGAEEAAYSKATIEALQPWTMTIALDRLLADIAITQSEGKSGGDNFSSDPPKIFVRENPAVLILIDGEPVLQKIAGTKFMRVVNSPAVIALDPGSGRYFLRGVGYWMTAGNVNGPWSKASDAPGSLSALLDPAEEANAPPRLAEGIPEVIVSTEPAELIQITGDPQFSPIESTRLLYITNTDSDLFLSLPQQHYYVLLSGRWFRAATLAGPWEFVEGSALPVDFSRIPGGHPRSAVLASIPGTPEARDAVVAAQVPQTATVDRKKATFTATYDGEPKFKRISGTEMSYAVNSPNDIIKARGKYYAVNDGVWFVADNPLGPWSVCDYVPPEIYSVPPTEPVYHVKYVHVYDSTPDYVYVGYTPGYFGSFIWNGVVVYGTGYYYPYWYSSYYFGWPWTWGFGFNYGYWGGGYYWRPWYPRPWYWHHWAHDSHPPHYWNRVLYNRSVAGRTGHDGFRGATVYDRWRSPGVVSRHPVPLRAPGRIVSRPRVTAPGTGTFRQGAPRTGAPRRDLYSDRSGHVYSHQNNSWYRRDGRSWEKIQPRITTPSAPQSRVQPRGSGGAPTRSHIGELERSRQARIQGQYRVDQYRRMPPSARITSPPPRIAAPRVPSASPRMSAPRTSSPRLSAPRPSAPRMSAPRSSAPRMSAPRGGGVRR